MGNDSEKHLAEPEQPHVNVGYPTRRRTAFRWLLVSALGSLALIYRYALVGSTSDPEFECDWHVEEKNPARVWETIKADIKLSWTPCYENKECAKLAVPLDYTDPSGPQAAIALTKIPSKIPPGQEGYRGPILINPGGPGGSGVAFVLRVGSPLATILGDGYDIIGFDPRGIGFTEPYLRVFTNAAEQAAWDLRHEYDPLLNTTPDALARQVATWSLFGDLASKRIGYEAQYVSTAFVARDMLRITEAHGYSKLSYWGFSYGSVLGITFAAIFPDKVERLVVDAVCDTYDYYETQWSNNLRNTDAGLDMFYEACAHADLETCALHESTGAAVKARVEAIFSRLKTHPITVLPNIGEGQLQYGILDYASARNVVFMFLYKPYYPGPTSLAYALAATERGNGRPMWELSQALKGKPEFRCHCGEDPEPETIFLGPPEQELAVSCSDGDKVDDTVEDLQEHFERMAKMSSFAELWPIRIQCSGWKIRPKERFRGPFAGNTSFPLLLIGNTADPVTSLWNAKKMALGFKDAAVLEQKSAGHGSISSASLCTAKVVRDYFRHGMVPKPGTQCEIESRMFDKPKDTETLHGLSMEDRELLRAVQELSSKWDPPKFYM